MSPILKLLALIAVLLLPAGAGFAQDAGGGKGKARGWVRLLPVGEAPPFLQEIRDGARHELEPPPGSLPPRQVEIPAVGKGGAAALRLDLGRVSEPAVTVSGTLSLRELDRDGTVRPEPWHQLEIPGQAAVLAILWRDPEEHKWTKPRSLLLRDDVASFAAGRLRFVNVSPYKVGVKFAGEDVMLLPGRSVVRGQPGQALGQTPLLLAVGDKAGKWLTIFNSAVSQAATERTNIVIFRADGMRPRHPAKALVLRERASFPKLPKP